MKNNYPDDSWQLRLSAWTSAELIAEHASPSRNFWLDGALKRRKAAPFSPPAELRLGSLILNFPKCTAQIGSATIELTAPDREDQANNLILLGPVQPELIEESQAEIGGMKRLITELLQLANYDARTKTNPSQLSGWLLFCNGYKNG